MHRAQGPVTAPDPLATEVLYRRCDPAGLPFATTDELKDLDQVLGQDRAIEAVRFGAGIKRDGYNLFALGPAGTGRHSVIGEFLRQRAAGEQTPSDWCYINNFADPQKPRALQLPAGRARPLRQDMSRLVEELKVAIPAVFESEDYRSRSRLIEEELKERQEQAFQGVEQKANERSIALVRTPAGLALAPVREGSVLGPKEFNALPEEEQQRFKADIEALQEELQETLRQFPRWEREAREQLRQLNREVTQYAVGHLIDELKKRYEDLPAVPAYLDEVQADVVDKAHQFMPRPSMPMLVGGGSEEDAAAAYRAYEVNVMVDNAGLEGAPLIYEDHPTLANLIGRIEHISRMGALVTDFTLIRPGALHRANGGYLFVDVRKLLIQPFAWEEFKRMLRSREIRIESLGQALSLISTVSLEPQAIPLDVKIVLFGDRMLYYLLCAYDPDFDALFKVPADFDDRTERSESGVEMFARQIATMARREKLRPLDRDAVGRVIEHMSRMAGDAERLSIHLRSLADLLREADYWATEKGDDVIKAGHVQTAIDAQIHRADRIRERLQEEITRGTVLIDTEGARAGQINGLAVLQLNSFAFGRPSRITARVRLGRGEVVDIERRVELGGPLHSKGVLILSGYLGAKFGQHRPLSLAASLVFEQSYSGVDGDSASSTELYALLSALADAPIKQSLAVTGSVNQYGQVQAIGGVNEKIEGFFDICKARGLSGDQGVLIPASNVKHLMLRQDVVEACARGEFQVYAVETIDQGIELLTGVPAGEADGEGNYPPETINHRVAARLDAFAAAARKYAVAARQASEEAEDEDEKGDAA